MEYNCAIRDMKSGMEVEGFYLLKQAAAKTTTAGKLYLAATIEDKTGLIEVKKWDYQGGIEQEDTGHVVKIRGEVSEYRGALQLTLGRIRRATESDVFRVTDLVPTAPIDRDGTMNAVRAMIASMEDGDYRALAEIMLEEHGEAFASIPAAKSMHHAFLSGLLMHTYNMLLTADFLAKLYPGVVNRSLLLTGTLLHDFAKSEEFAFSELGLVTGYTTKGKLLGHLVMGAEEVRKAAEGLGLPEEKIMLLTHMILSHHGEPEFGAAVIPRFAEAELLYHIDLIDSRMEIVRENLENVEPGAFSSKIFALDRDLYRHE